MAAGEEPESLLRRLLRAAGYRLEERPAGLSAYRARDRRGLLVVARGGSPAELEPEFSPDAVHRTLIYPEDPGDPARVLASARGIEILDSTTLGPALGELLLLSGQEEPTARPAASDAPALEAPASIFPEGARTVQPRLGSSDAEVIAGVQGFRTRLRLLPFYVVPYRVRAPSATGTPGPTSEHVVSVNALTGAAEVWDPGERELGDEPTEAEERIEPRLTEAECRAVAERELRARHTVSIDHTEQHGGTIVIERRRVAPGSSDLKLGSGVFLRVPYWYVEGREGRFVIDAVNGSRSQPEFAEAR